jgi:hypothetical protein
MATPVEHAGKFYNAANYGPIEKLTMLNYFSWKQSMIFHLNSLRVLDIVNGTRPALPPNTSRERREALATETALASSVIHGACSTGVHPHLTGLMDPHEMWLKLQTQFDSASSASARETILFNLSHARPEHGELIGDFISRITVLRERLVASPEEVDDATFIRYLLRALPAEYNILKEILFNLDLTVDQVIQRITHSAVAQGIIQPSSANSSSVSSTALAAHIPSRSYPTYGSYRGGNTRRGGRGGPGRRLDPIRGRPALLPFENPLILARQRGEDHGTVHQYMICWECGETGHGQRACPFKGQTKTPEQQRKGYEAYRQHLDKQRARRESFTPASAYANLGYYDGAQEPPSAL